MSTGALIIGRHEPRGNGGYKRGMPRDAAAGFALFRHDRWFSPTRLSTQRAAVKIFLHGRRIEKLIRDNCGSETGQDIARTLY